MRVLRHAAGLLVAAFVALGAAAGEARAATPVLDRAARGLAADPVYVDPSAPQAISGADADRIRRAITARRAEPMYVAVLPAAAVAEAGGSPDRVIERLQGALRRDGTYAVIAGTQFRAGSTNIGGTGAAADDAFAAHKRDGVTATVLDFIDRVGRLRAGDDSGSGDGGNGPGGVGAVLFLGLAAVGGGALLLSRRRRRARESGEFAEVKANARDDLVALDEDIGAVGLDASVAGAARTDLARAVSACERARRQWDAAREPEDLEGVAAALEEGRWALASATARVAGHPPPERRPPCLFDPRHGPSARDVDWAPPGGSPRPVPACEADAQRVERGEDPEAREVLVGGRHVPYWDAGPVYAPWAGGFFGGLGGGLFPRLLAGTVLGEALWPGVAWGDDDL